MAIRTVRSLWRWSVGKSAEKLLSRDPLKTVVATLAESRIVEGEVDHKRALAKNKSDIRHDVVAQVKRFGMPVDSQIDESPLSEPTKSRLRRKAVSLKVNEGRQIYLDATEADFWNALGRDLGWLACLQVVATVLSFVFLFIFSASLLWFILVVGVHLMTLGLWFLSRARYIRYGEFFFQIYCPRIGRGLRFGRIPVEDFNSIVAMLTNEALNGITSPDSPSPYDKLKPHLTEAVRRRDLLVTTQTLTDIREYVKDRPGNVIGISGTRGIGKTSIVDYLTRFPSLGTMVPLTLPALSDNVDVARLMLHALADRIAGTPQPSLIRKRMRQGMTWSSIGLAALLLLLPSRSTYLDISRLGDVTNYWQTWLTNVPHLVGLASGVGLVGIIILAWGSAQNPARALARDIRDSLLYEDTHSATATISASPSVLSTPLALSGVRGRIRKARGLDAKYCCYLMNWTDYLQRFSTMYSIR